MHCDVRSWREGDSLRTQRSGEDHGDTGADVVQSVYGGRLLLSDPNPGRPRPLTVCSSNLFATQRDSSGQINGAGAPVSVEYDRTMHTNTAGRAITVSASQFSRADTGEGSIMLIILLVTWDRFDDTSSRHMKRGLRL